MLKVQQLKIDFNVTPHIKRFVYVYVVETENGCCLIDSGVAGSEKIIEECLMENGLPPSDVKAVFFYACSSGAYWQRALFSRKIWSKDLRKRGRKSVDRRHRSAVFRAVYTKFL